VDVHAKRGISSRGKRELHKDESLRKKRKDVRIGRKVEGVWSPHSLKVGDWWRKGVGRSHASTK
jgi:hypothetical protein